MKPELRYPTILFDFDGTLFDTRLAIRETLSELLHRSGKIATCDERIDAVISAGLSLTDMISGLFPNSSQEEHEEWMAEYRRIYNSGIGLQKSVPYPGVKNGLEELQEVGAEMFVVTNKGEKSVQGTLQHYSLLSLFRAVVATRGNEPTKPSRQSFDLRIRPLMRASFNTGLLMVGDTEVDIQYARNIGAISCWAAYGYGQLNACVDCKPHLVVKKFPEILRVCI